MRFQKKTPLPLRTFLTNDLNYYRKKLMHMQIGSIVLCSLQDLMAEVESVVEEILVDEVLDIAKAGAQYISVALR